LPGARSARTAEKAVASITVVVRIVKDRTLRVSTDAAIDHRDTARVGTGNATWSVSAVADRTAAIVDHTWGSSHAANAVRSRAPLSSDISTSARRSEDSVSGDDEVLIRIDDLDTDAVSTTGAAGRRGDREATYFGCKVDPGGHESDVVRSCIDATDRAHVDAWVTSPAY
jgi:hypothetical protein